MAIFGKLAYDAGVGVLTLLFVRFAIAAPVLWVARAAAAAALRRPPAPRTLLAALTLGAVGYAMQAGLYFAALERMDASLLSMLLYTFPAFVTVAAIALGRETPSRRRIGALLVSSGGLRARAARRRRGRASTGSAPRMGVGAALTYTAYILVSDRVGGGIEALPLSALVTTGAAITFGIAGAATGSLDAGFAQRGLGLARRDRARVDRHADRRCSSPGCGASARRRRRSSRRSSRRPRSRSRSSSFGESLTGGAAGRRRARARRRRRR